MRNRDKTVTVYEVAAQAGVSIATVSRALRRPDVVGEATRQRVLDVVDRLGYVPSGSARGLAERKTGILGVFLPSFDAVGDIPAQTGHGDPVTVVRDVGLHSGGEAPGLYYDEMLRGCETEAWQSGFSLMIGVGEGKSVRQQGTLLNDMAGRVDGMAVLAERVPPAVLQRIGTRVPVVSVAGPDTDGAFDHVGIDNRAAMGALTAHILEAHGVRTLAYIAGPLDSPDGIGRLQGFTEALVRHGIDPETVAVLDGAFSRAMARERAEHLIAQGTLPRAIVCANDQMALGVCDVLTGAGIRIPDDVILTGFDGILASATSRPRLTTVAQPMAGLGHAAVRTLVARILNPESDPVRLVLPVRVLLRESCESTAGGS